LRHFWPGLQHHVAEQQAVQSMTPVRGVHRLRRDRTQRCGDCAKNIELFTLVAAARGATHAVGVRKRPWLAGVAATRLAFTALHEVQPLLQSALLLHPRHFPSGTAKSSSRNDSMTWTWSSSGAMGRSIGSTPWYSVATASNPNTSGEKVAKSSRGAFILLVQRIARPC